MKRSAALTPLSHDHQHGLAVALDLKRATDASAGEAAAGFLAYWRAEGREHFRIEEELLIPALSPYVPPTNEAVARVFADHALIRRCADDLEGTQRPEPSALHALGERLHDHIRHEERVLFPLAEKELPAEDLQRLGERITMRS